MFVRMGCLHLAAFLLSLAGCGGQLTDPSNLSRTPAISDKFEEWDPDLIKAPGVHLITFTEGDSYTTFPYYQAKSTYQIKFKVNAESTEGAIDPGFYSVKLEYSSDNGSAWTVIPGADRIPCASGIINSFDWNISSSYSEGNQYLIKVTAFTVSNDSKSVKSSRTFVVDGTGPTINSFSLTDGSLGVANPTTINRSFFGFSMRADDNLSPIRAYCIKTNGLTTLPSVDDDCWSYLREPYSLNFDEQNIPGFIGFVAGAYQLRVWVQDFAGNISMLTAGTGTVGIDLLNIAYNPSEAPEVTNVIVSNNDSSSLNPSDSELVINQGQSVFIRWKVVDSDLVSYPISIYYTTDEENFHPVQSLQNITNSSHGCTVNASYTGCASFSAPTSEYFRVQVKALDQTGLISLGGSQAVNMKNFRLLFGNTDLGLNGSANKALFINKTDESDNVLQTGILAVTKRGKLFYLDKNRGVLVVDPLDGTQKIYVAKSTTGESTGDNGPYSSATTLAYKISLDYEDRLLILEQDRIRRVGHDGTINTIVGGGGVSYDNATKSSIPALEFKMNLGESSSSLNTNFYLFQPLPNGNIWFSLNHQGTFDNDSGLLFGIYKSADRKVYFLGLKGNGVYGDPTRNLVSQTHLFRGVPGLSFDFRTSQPRYITTYFCLPVPGGCHFYSSNFNAKNGFNVAYGTQYATASYWSDGAYISSRKGQTYLVSRFYPPALFKLNNSTLQWDRVLGTGESGNTGLCLDGVSALSCDTDLADAFISEDGTTYFVDRGGIIRVILPNGKVKTLFGQSRSFGDGGSSSSARLGTVRWMGVWGTENKIVVYDQSEKYIREATPTALGVVEKLCGNGRTGVGIISSSEIYSSDLAVNRPCFGGYWGSNSAGMVVDKRNGEIYTLTGVVAKLIRSGVEIGRWKQLVGGGGDYCFQNTESDHKLGTNVASCSRTTGGGYPITVLGLFHPDTDTTSAALGAVEDGSSAAHVLMSSQVWTGDRLIESFYRTARGTDGMIRPISGINGADVHGGLPSVVGEDFQSTLNKPIYESYTKAIYVQEDRSVLFGTFGYGHLVRAPLKRTSADVPDAINGAGLISHIYSGLTAYSSYNYKWEAGNVSKIYYCSTNGRLYKYTTATNTSKACPFPKNSFGQDMFTCYGLSLEWDSTKTRLIFPVYQNGVTSVAQYEVSACE